MSHTYSWFCDLINTTAMTNLKVKANVTLLCWWVDADRKKLYGWVTQRKKSLSVPLRSPQNLYKVVWNETSALID